MPCRAAIVPRATLALAAALSGCGAAWAESIDRQVLPSGLTLITGELHLSQAVDVRVAVRAGPRDEGELLGSGISLLTQRLIVGAGQAPPGGEALPPGAVREAIARLGDGFEARCTPAGATYAITTTSANLAAALQVLAGMVGAPVFGQEDLDRERQALAREPAAGGEAAALLGLMYRQHPARLPVAGLAGLRDQLTLDAVRSYRAARYRAAATTVVVVGNVNTNDVRRLVEQDFAGYPVGGFATAPAPAEPPPFAPRYQALAAPPGPPVRPRVTLAWRTETPENANQPALTVLAYLLGGERGLVQRALAARQLADDIEVRNQVFPDQPGFVSIAFSASADDRAEAEQTLYRALEALDAEGPAPDDLDAARRQAERELAWRRTGVRGLGDDLLAWEWSAGDPAYGRRFADQVHEVGAQDVARVLRRYLQSREGERGRCTVVVRPATAPVPVPVEGTVPHPASQIMPEVVPIGRGVRLLVRPAQEAPLASLHLVLGGGSSAEDAVGEGATALLAETMGQATETRTPADIAALLDSHGMRFAARARRHCLDLGIDCFPGDVDLALDLLFDLLTKAALPVDEIERGRRRALRAVQLAEDRWDDRLLVELRRIVLDGHYAARDPRGSAEGLAHLDRSQLVAQLRRLAVGANTVIAVYGHVDAAALADRLKALVAARTELGEGAPLRPLGTPWPEKPPPPLTVGTYDLPRASLAIAWRAPALDDQARDQAPMAVLGALIDARVARALGAQAAPGPAPLLRSVGESYARRGLWVIEALVEPVRLDATQQAIRDEIARCIAQLWLPEGDRGALPDGELAAAKAQCATAWALRQEDQGECAVAHATTLLAGGSIAVDIAEPERLVQVSRKDLLRVAQTWLAGEPAVVVYKPKAADGMLHPAAEVKAAQPISTPASVAPPARGGTHKAGN